VSVHPTADVEWNAGELGCGDLVLQLMLRMNAMPPGHVLRLVALDPGAPADLPAWCRMTGHTLLEAQHPVYLIRAKTRGSQAGGRSPGARDTKEP
jgi:tRNA 2-thiouridine synthesizing protein A